MRNVKASFKSSTFTDGLVHETRRIVEAEKSHQQIRIRVKPIVRQHLCQFFRRRVVRKNPADGAE